MPPRDEGPDALLLALQEALKGRYSIQRELGRGGMGVVYLAQEVVLDRPVALKVLPPELAREPSFSERFLREARTAAGLSHPHIVPIHAVGEVDDFVFFAMAYVEGETLGQRIRRRGPLPAAQAARILREVSWALGYAHAQGVVHRDVKPDNILLDAETGRALVTDFGIAAAVVAEGDTASDPDPALTGPRDVVGTPEFMSPEQASGEPADGRSDIYSLGVVGYYALSGQLPFRGETPAATVTQHLTAAAPPVRSAAPETPMPLAKALDRCLAKNPNARFANGEELAAALGGALPRKREVPPAVRGFMEETHSQAAGMVAVGGVGVYAMAISAVGAIIGGPPWWALTGSWAAGLGLTATPVGMMIRRVRTLLRSGHDHDELVRVLSDEIEDRRQALEAARGPESSRLDRWLNRATWGGLSAYAGGLLWMGWGPYIQSPLFWTLFAGGMALAAVFGLGGALLSAGRAKPAKTVRGERWLRFWRSRAGRGVFAAAGIGLEPALPAGPGYRPTAVAIGMAADRLFNELPTQLRQEFGDLPAVVSALEADAEAARAQIEFLDAAAAGAPVGKSLPPSMQAEQGAQGIGESREEAEARLARVVSALESIRLQLIRMHAGIGAPELLTQRLGDARALAKDIERVADGAREVDAILGIAPPREEADSPTPA